MNTVNTILDIAYLPGAVYIFLHLIDILKGKQFELITCGMQT